MGLNVDIKVPWEEEWGADSAQRRIGMMGQNNSYLESTDKLVCSSCSSSHLCMWQKGPKSPHSSTARQHDGGNPLEKAKKNPKTYFSFGDKLELYIGQTLSSFIDIVKDKGVKCQYKS